MTQALRNSNNLLYRTVGKKQDGDNARWQYVWAHIAEIVPQERAVQLVTKAALEVQRATRGKSVGYAWSGGKDSQALRVVMERAEVKRCVLGMTADLEYPEFLRWAGDNMPPGLDVLSTG